MDLFSKIEKIASDIFFEYGYVEIKNLKFNQEVRTICEQNSCRNYATSWACPPAIGTLSQCKERVNHFNKMLLFTRKYELEDSFDFESMVSGLKNFKDCVDKFQQELNAVLSDYLLLSNEGCSRCKKCTYPDSPCRFPKLLHHSLEGYGFIVKELADAAGIHYNNGTNTVTYFGALLFNENSSNCTTSVSING